MLNVIICRECRHFKEVRNRYIRVSFECLEPYEPHFDEVEDFTYKCEHPEGLRGMNALAWCCYGEAKHD